MNLIEKPTLSQEQVCSLQDHISKGALPPVELTYEHHFASGVYGRIMKAPAGTVVVGKPHRTEHLCVLLKGALIVTKDDGSLVEMRAPAVFVAQAGQKKAALVTEDLEFMNVHAVETTDLDEIEKQVIIPEEEFRQMLINTSTVVERLKEAAMDIAVQS